MMATKTLDQAKVIYDLAKQLPLSYQLMAICNFIAWGAELAAEEQKETLEDKKGA